MSGMIVLNRRDIVSVARSMIYVDRPCYNNFVDLQFRAKEERDKGSCVAIVTGMIDRDP